MTAWPPRRGPLETPGVVAGETQLATQSPPRAAPYPRTCRRVARNSRVMSLPLLCESDPWVDEPVDEIGDEGREDDEDRGEERGRHDDRVVALERGRDGDAADAGKAEEALDDHAAAEQQRRDRADDAHDRDERVAQDVTAHDRGGGGALARRGREEFLVRGSRDGARGERAR